MTPPPFFLVFGRAQRLHPAAQRAEEARALRQGGAPADQAGQGLLPRQVLSTGDHPWQAGRNAGAAKRRNWLPANELGGATRHPATLRRSRWRSGSGSRWRPRDPGGPILQLSDKTYFLDPWRRSAPAHEGPEERASSCPARRTCCRAPSRTSRSACRQLAELLQLSVEEV